MLSLVLALALTSPQPLQRCVTACFERGNVFQCFYDAAPSCHPSRPECIDSPTVECIPRAVSLGTWDPRPAPSAPLPTYQLTPPPDSRLTPIGP